MVEDKGLLMEMLRRMLRIRYFDEQATELVQRGELVGAVHTYIGEEAVAVGACLSLRDDDYITGNHRSHGHPIAKGGDVRWAMAELHGKATGYCKGKGGSMNLASIWKLPVVFVCENNQYAVTTRFSDVVAVENISDRAVAYNMPGVLVDGQDVVAMYETVSAAVSRARAGGGPSLIEGRTYRYQDHSEGLSRVVRDSYRTEEEEAYWRNRDPIAIHKERLVAQGIAAEAEVSQMEEEERARIAEALEFARQSPYPEPDAVFEDMFANPIPIDRS